MSGQAWSGSGHEGGDFDFDLGPDVDQPVDVEQCRWRELRPSVSFHAAPMPGPAASYSLRLVRYQVRRTICSGPAPASPSNFMMRFSAVPTWAAMSGV